MDLKMFSLTVMFFCLMQSGFSLKCYDCQQETNKKCHDMSDKSIKQSTCPNEQVCVKVVVNRGYKREVGRACGPSYACDKAKQILPPRTRVKFCSICHRDGCNSANSLKWFSVVVVFGTILNTMLS